MIEEIKVSKKKIKLSQEEKDYVEKIASIINKDKKDVQEVFLALVACITMDIYAKKTTLHIPYLFKADIKLKKKIIPKGFEHIPEFNVEAADAFKDIFEKLNSSEKTWIEEFIQSMLFKEIALRME